MVFACAFNLLTLEVNHWDFAVNLKLCVFHLEYTLVSERIFNSLAETGISRTILTNIIWNFKYM